jgi:hypothetical protein
MSIVLRWETFVEKVIVTRDKESFHKEETVKKRFRTCCFRTCPCLRRRGQYFNDDEYFAIKMEGNLSSDEHYGDLFGNESMSHGLGAGGGSQAWKESATKSTDSCRAVKSITFIYMLLMLIMSNVFAKVLREYYREIIYFEYF